MLLLDLTHTSHTPARTGVQRVCRSLHAALARRDSVHPVTFDPFEQRWRSLDATELRGLTAPARGRRRSAQWSWGARWRGRWRRWTRQPARALPMAFEGIVVPEIFSPAVAGALPSLFAQGRPRVAVFHDAIPLRLPEYTPAKTVARFPAYLQELTQFDGIAAVSEDSRAALIDYWNWLELPRTPPVAVLPLGTDSAAIHAPAAPAPTPGEKSPAPEPVVLSVGSIEGRKNHLALLNACENLWVAGERFRLHLIGLARPETARPALERIAQLRKAGRPLQYDGVVDDAALAAAYARCLFTVYPSVMEGFGLPVIESLQHQRACICSARGALGEVSRAGGCLALDDLNTPALTDAIRTLLHDAPRRDALVREAEQRRFRTWDEYVDDLLLWLDQLRAV